MTPRIEAWVASRTDGLSTEEQALANIQAARVRRLVRGLPEVERRVVAWHYGIGCAPATFAQIAERLGISAPTAYRIERRAIGRLRSRGSDLDSAQVAA